MTNLQTLQGTFQEAFQGIFHGNMASKRGMPVGRMTGSKATDTNVVIVGDVENAEIRLTVFDSLHPRWCDWWRPVTNTIR